MTTSAWMLYTLAHTPAEVARTRAGLPAREQDKCKHPALAMRFNTYNDEWGQRQTQCTCLDCHKIWGTGGRD